MKPILRMKLKLLQTCDSLTLHIPLKKGKIPSTSFILHKAASLMLVHIIFHITSDT